MNQNFAKMTKVLATSLGLTAEELMSAYDRAKASELIAVTELMRLGFGEVDNLKQDVIAWRYFNFSKNSSDIFVLRHQGRLIGAIGAEPIKVHVGEREYEGIIASDIVVHPDHLKRGIGAWMNLYLQDRFPIVMAMGSNANSNVMVRRLFKPMRCRHHFKMLFSIKRYLEVRDWPPIFIHIVSALAVLPLTVLRVILLKPLPLGYTITVADNSRVLAGFFKDVEYQARPLNRVTRSLGYCQWRYDANPKSQYKVFQLTSVDQCLGYAVVKVPAGGAEGDWQLMDWDFLPKCRDMKHARILFSALARSVAKEGAQSLTVMTSDKLSRKSLGRTGFSLRALDDGFFLWSQEHVDPAVRDANSWFLSFCDTDEAL